MNDDEALRKRLRRLVAEADGAVQVAVADLTALLDEASRLRQSNSRLRRQNRRLRLRLQRARESIDEAGPGEGDDEQ
ncbi:MAG TPA: hypothetical protein ENI87_00170 [bacterium]|nr:hypothetical protein [bacterium]